MVRNKYHLWRIIGLSLCTALLCYMLSGHYHLDDGPSYRNAKNFIDDASFDTGRTPIYPLLIAFIRLFCADPYLTYALIFIQIAIFLLSIPFFHRIVTELTHSGKISLYVTLLYACCPHIIYWNRCTLTESLSITGMVFFVYHVASYLRTNRTRHILSFHVILFLLIMLRPAFLYLLPAIMLFWIYGLIFLKRKRDFLKGAFLMTVTGLLLFFYAQNMLQKTGVFSLTTVSTINKYVFFRQNGLLDNIEPSSPVAFEVAGFRNMTVADELNVLRDKYGYSGIERFLALETKKNYGNYLSKVLINIQQNGRKLVFIPGGFREDDNSTVGEIILKAIVSVNLFFQHLYLFLFIYAPVLIILFQKHKERLTLPLFLWVIVCAHMTTIFLGSYGQYSRLTAPVYPLLILMFGQTACFFKVKLRNPFLLPK
ncbi:MAG: hypothetical protein LBF08_02380 [Dysgonamonadaceae bacterium]|jgi:hypothetical protein|nr:hypothetical protein [Dysgonamonadaceae bacterium]